MDSLCHDIFIYAFVGKDLITLMHLLKEILVGVVVGASFGCGTRVCGYKPCRTGIVYNSLEILLGQFIVGSPVGTPSIECTIVLCTHNLEGQDIALTVNSPDITTTSLIAASFQCHTSDKSFNKGS